MANRRGFVSPGKAAKMLDIHHTTARAWARSSADGEPSRFSNVIRHPITRWLAIPIEEVNKLKNGGDDDGQ